MTYGAVISAPRPKRIAGEQLISPSRHIALFPVVRAASNEHRSGFDTRKYLEATYSVNIPSQTNVSRSSGRV
jgi:hypothetical protein